MEQENEVTVRLIRKNVIGRGAYYLWDETVEDPTNLTEEEETEYEEYQPQKYGLGFKVRLLLFIALAVSIIIVVVPHIGQGSKQDKEVNKIRAEELIYAMYNNKDVEQIIGKNESILNFFAGDSKHLADISDPNLFVVRYAEFSNTKTTVEINTSLQDVDGTVYLLYTITNKVDIPAKRLAVITFNENNKIEEFNEMRYFPVIDTGEY